MNLGLLVISLLVTAGGTGAEKVESCSWHSNKPFSENIQCLLERHRRQTQPDYNIYGHPCLNYVNLLQPERRVGHVINHLTDSALCDRVLKRQWYRFQGPAGGVMPQTCINEYDCGTHAPIWLNGEHPSFYGEVFDLPVCVSLAGDCCERTWYVRVANCGEFYTYLLSDTPGCFMAYCAGRQEPCPAGQSSVTGYSPGCSDNFPRLAGHVELHIGEHGHEVAVYCDYNGAIPPGSVIETEWFVDGDHSGPADQGRLPVFLDSMRGRRRSVLEEGHWMGKMGSNIYCRMRARWYNRTGVPSPYLESQKHFAGIQITKRVVEVSEAEDEAVIQVQATMPVSCLPQFSDACKITLELSHDSELGGKRCIDGAMQQVVFGDCSVDITASNWREPQNITVKAVRDFYRDGNKNMRVDFKPIYSTTSSPLWDNYKLPDVEVIAKDVEKALCSSTGDPHLSTFDGLYYHVYLEGEFVLYKHTRLPLQINTRLEECGKTVTCNCAVAVKAADDFIVIDRCKRQQRNLAYGASFPEGWRSLHRHALEQGEDFVDGLKLYEYDNGKRYTIHLPTGAYIDFKVGEHWINIYLYGSSDDWRSTLGLCGTFDENRDNDMTFPDGWTTVHARPNDACGDSEAVCKFAEAWRVADKDSFFGPVIEVPVEDHEFFQPHKYCKCEKTDGKSTVTCNYHYDVMNCQGEQNKQYGVDKTDDVKIRARSMSGRHKRSVDGTLSDDVMDYFGEVFVYNSSFKGQIPRWPTPSGITEAYARRYCDDVIFRSRASYVCNQIIQDKLNQLVDECMTDIKVTDDLVWAMASLTSMTEECQNQIHDDPTYWTIPHETQANQYSYNNTHGAALLVHICPGDCSKKGTCDRGVCRCIHGYEGSDCSTNSFTVPVMHYVSDNGFCDHHTRPCDKIKVYGTGFRQTDDKFCYFVAEDEEFSTDLTLVTFEEVFCTLPSRDDFARRPAVTQYHLIVVQNSRESESRRVTLYDSRCYTCDHSDVGAACVRTEAGSCIIDGVCYGPNDHNPENCCQMCDPVQSNGSFTAVTASSPIRLFPRQTSYTIIQGSPWKLTAKAFGGSGCDFQYTTSSNDNTVFDHVITSKVLQTMIKDDVVGRYELTVTATDPCGGSVSRDYDITVKPRPPTDAPQSQKTCTDNLPPQFPEDTSVHFIFVDGVLNIQMNATEPDGDAIEYFVIKRSDSYVTITKDGKLRYHAGKQAGKEKLVVEAIDPCGNKGRHVLYITSIECACANDGTCVMSPNSNSGEYLCICTAEYTGDMCNIRM